MTAATAITTDARQRRSDVDPDTLRSVLGSFCTGVTVVTAHDGDRPYGFACQSVTSLSLEPPYVSLCPARTSTSWPAMRAAGRVCINVLAGDQRDVCSSFAAGGGDKFAGIAWSRAANGAPAVHGVLARIEADLVAEHEAGDHTIAICRVTALDDVRAADPLLFFRGGLGSFGEPPAGVRP